MPASQQDRPRILCVDDEAQVVQALALHLRKNYLVTTALGGEEALRTLKKMGGAAVVISDMRMPGMDGATLLNNVMHLYPATSRILLTGEPGREAAVSAVNKGHIFRFLTKPCASDDLKAAVEAGVVRYRVVISERAILKETLNGCVLTLLDVLALTNPTAFGRAGRLRRLVMQFAASIGCGDYWQLEAATLLLQIGYLPLPVALLEKIHSGARLTPQETLLVEGVPHNAGVLLKKVPRLDPVVEILMALTWTDEQIVRLGDSALGLCTRILGLILDYDALLTRGHTVEVAIHMLRKRPARFGATLVKQFHDHIAAKRDGHALRDIPLGAVEPGMTIAQDVRTPSGTLVLARGAEVTDALLENTRAFPPDLLTQSIRILESPAATADEAPQD